jgi:excisionase family DNA binding protein
MENHWNLGNQATKATDRLYPLPRCQSCECEVRKAIMSNNTNDNCELEALEDLLKPQDISKKLKISRSFTYRLLQTGELPAVRLGKTYRVRPKDLAEFIEKNLRRQADYC